MAGFGRRARGPRHRAAEPDTDRDAETGAAADPPADPVSAARTVCLNLLTTRARTRSELAHELGRREFADGVVEPVLDRLVEVGLLDDAAFAEQWVGSRHRHRGLGRRALADELRRKGVDGETAGVALDELAPEDERTKARELVDRRLPSLDRIEPAAAVRRLVGMLARKGYSGGMAYEVVREAVADRNAETVPDAEPDDAVD